VTYHIYVDKYAVWHWYLITDDGELITTSSRPYPSEAECRKTIDLIKMSAHAPVVVVPMQP
jgi:uncharacterized protein YegP (UPF0339 family)